MSNNFETGKFELTVQQLILMSIHAPKGFHIFVSVSPHVKWVSVSVQLNVEQYTENMQNPALSERAYWEHDDSVEQITAIYSKVKTLLTDFNKQAKAA